jgi:hypothetical protein
MYAKVYKYFATNTYNCHFKLNYYCYDLFI